MKDKEHELDQLLSQALKTDTLYEEPSDELIRRLEKQVNNEESNMKPKRAFKLSTAVAIVIIASLSLSMVVFGGTILEALGFRVVEGEEYVLSYYSGEGWGYLQAAPEGGRIVAQWPDGELWIVQDPLILTDLEEAIELFAGVEYLKLPTYLPEGFEFYQAEFPISPINNPDLDYAGYLLFILFSNGEEFFQFGINVSNIQAPIDFDFYGIDVIPSPDSLPPLPGIVPPPEPIPALPDDIPPPEPVPPLPDVVLPPEPIPPLLEAIPPPEPIPPLPGAVPPPELIPPLSDVHMAEHPEELVVFIGEPWEVEESRVLEEIILSNGHTAWLFDHTFMLDFVFSESGRMITYSFNFGSSSHRPGADLGRETLIRMAESLEYVNP